jgi:phosphoserine phosphatase RsbU/P
VASTRRKLSENQPYWAVSHRVDRFGSSEVGPTRLDWRIMSNSSSSPPNTCSSGKLPAARCVSSELRPGRKTIAVLVDYIDQTTDGYESELRAGFEAQCRLRDVNLLIVVGRALSTPVPHSAHFNDIYPLLIPSCTDALILVSAGLAEFIGLAELACWCRTLGPLPLCSLGVTMPGVPSIVADNRAGMRAVVEHVVVGHRRKKMVYLHGGENPDGIERLEVFRAVVAEQGLFLNPRLILNANFEISHAKQSILALLDQGTEFDSVIAANDGMAVGALRALDARRIRVPQDVLVSGFDDLGISRVTEPAITTVRQPLKRMATLAVDSIIDQWEGHHVSECTTVSTQLVVRDSCGCGRATLTQPGQAIPSDPVVRGLSEAITAELGGQRGALVASVEEILAALDLREGPGDTLLPVLDSLRVQFNLAWTSDIEAAWSAAQRAIFESIGRRQVSRRIHVEAQYVWLFGVIRHVGTSPDVASLQRGLQEILPNIHDKDLAIGLLPGGKGRHVELLAMLKNGKSLPLPSELVDVTQLFTGTRRRTVIALPITTEARIAGVIAIEVQDSFFNYQILLDQISTAVRAVALRQEAVHQATLHERSVQERLATAERMRSLSVLAGGVAHDLNNSLGS